jgi:rhodanese-related sulfurtransferase
MLSRPLVTAIALLIATVNQRIFADDAASPSPEQGPYCGIYCVYAAAKYLERPIDFASLAKPQYVGSKQGSSAAELKRAAEGNGLFAEVVANLTIDSLRHSSYPMILHVKSSGAVEGFDHWLLMARREQDWALMLDAPAPPRLVDFAELSGKWDGRAVIVSTDPIDLSAVSRPLRMRMIFLAAFASGAIIGIKTLQRLLPVPRHSSVRSHALLSFAQAVALTTVTAAGAIAYHRTSDEGLLKHPQAVAGLQRAHFEWFDHATLDDVNRVALGTSQDGPVLIDARLSADYHAGHIPTAVSVPVNASASQRQKALAAQDRHRPLIIYCQSEGCPFAKKLAGTLAAEGFEHLAIFTGGWRAWSAANPTTQPVR